MKKGIDVSDWQKEIDYMQVKADGIDFAIIRCGFGKNESQYDKRFERNYSGFKYAGIKIGTYLYSYVTSVENARLEAQNCLKFIEGKEFDLPVFYDLEDKETKKLGKEKITECAIAFCEEIEKAGYKAGIYANLDWFTNYIDIEKVKKYSLWLAQWNARITAEFEPNFWQFGNNGNIKGIKGRVDVNYMLKETTVETVDNSVNNLSIEELAKKVILGEFGNGQDRKEKLGTRYNEVQAKVNEILSKNNIDELAKKTIRGEFGNGQERKEKLSYLYNIVQARVNEILKGK